MNGEKLYQSLKQGKVQKSQLNKQQLSDIYKYMLDSGKAKIDDFKPEAIQYYNLDNKPIEPVRVTKGNDMPKPYTPSRSPDTNAPIITPTYTPTHIPSRSPDTNAINYQPPKSTTPEMELVDILSNITIPTRGRTTQHERQQGSADRKSTRLNSSHT